MQRQVLISESDHKVRHENLVLSTEVNRLNIKSIYPSKKVKKRMFRGLALLQSGQLNFKLNEPHE